MFKCLGCTKQVQFQEKLAQIAVLLNSDKHVPCRLELEPDNPIDSKAIAFSCYIGESWCTIGYVVSEVLDRRSAFSTGREEDHQHCNKFCEVHNILQIPWLVCSMLT